MFDRLNQGIYWDKFWRLVDGCTPAGPECRGCWFAREANMRIYGAKHLLENGHWSGQVEAHIGRLEQPLHVKKPRVWFVLNDLYHEHVHPSFIIRAYEVMSEAKQHIFIICTKRPERIVPVLYGEEGRLYLSGGDYLPNIWHMTTAGNQEMADRRIPELLKLRQASPGWPVLGVSIEPMLSDINLMNLHPDRWTSYNALEGCGTSQKSPCQSIPNVFGGKLNLVILGGESGTRARPMYPDWPRKVRDDCQAAGVPFLFKQWGEWFPMISADEASQYPHADMHEWDDGIRTMRIGKKAAGRLLDGREYNELPEVK